MLEMFNLTKSRTSGFDGGYNIDLEFSRITIRWRVAIPYRRERVHINVKFTVVGQYMLA